jgi:hypothetical protein
MPTPEEVVNSLRVFKSRRDNLLHEDVATFDHNFERFLEYCRTDRLAQSVFEPLEGKSLADLDEWWAAATKYHEPKLSFPSDPDEELALRYRLIMSAQAESNHIINLGIAHGKEKLDEWVELFRTLVLRPFVDDLSQRLGKAADLATPEARDLQAVPLNRIPLPTEAKIFLSHRSIDKPVVHRYHQALQAVGFDPWLDESNMPVGSNLERELLRGFEQSCAAVFFITPNFKDEKYLATEIDYAIMEKRRKENKFVIITLRYAEAASIPALLARYVYKNVANDLEGFQELVRALPIEVGPIRWKADVV